MLKLTLLGSPQVNLAGQSLSERITGKHLALLVYLAVTGRTHTRDSLAALLWRDMANSQARKNLRDLLSDLRKHVSPYLMITRHDIAFNPDAAHWLDVTVFRTHVDSNRIKPYLKLWADVIDLYRGDFLEGFNVRNAPAFEAWVLQQREELQAQVVQGLRFLADQHLSQADFTAGLSVTDRWLALEPWSEEAHRYKMRLLAYSGQRSAALTQYDICRQVLDEELGVAPLSETEELYGQLKIGLLEQESISSDNEEDNYKALLSTSPLNTLATFSHNLPSKLSIFVNRNRERNYICESLSQPECRLLTITGIGGVGKTRLALEAAYQMATASSEALPFSDGIFFVSLADLDETPPPSESSIVAAVGQVLAPPGEDREESFPSIQQLLTYLQDKAMLLVLDNFEPLMDQVNFIPKLLRHCPHLKVLVTSRVRLNIEGEWLLPLEGLSVPQATEDNWQMHDAVVLFLAHARTIDPKFAVDAQTAQAIVRICQSVQGLPLGIELAAGWLRLLDCDAIANSLADSLDGLSATRRDLPNRHRSLRATIDYSWRLLTEGEQEALLRLSTLPGPFLAQEAQEVGRASLPLLLSLVDQSFLRPLGGNRYEMQGLVHQYMLEKRQENLHVC